MKQILKICCLCALLSIAQTVSAQRNCRPQLAEKGIPEHSSAFRRIARSRLNIQSHTVDDINDKDSTLIGDRRQLVVMAAFADRSFLGSEAETMELWNKVFNAQHFQEAPFSGSVHDYFYDQSYGQLRLSFDLHYVALSDDVSKYRSTQDDDENSKYFVQDIVDSLKSRGIDWSSYDWDGDGFIDQLLIVYAGKGMNAGGGSNSIWPHQSWLSWHSDCQPIQVSSDSTNYLVDSYCCVQELSYYNTYGAFGTICHEYSHCFGLPDFYNGSQSFVLDWDLMDYGSYGNGGFTPAGYSSFERAFMGWMNLKELSCDTVVADMPALADEPLAYLVRNDGHPNEFYLIENRQQTKWDSSLPGSGILIFHVDYDKNLFQKGMPNKNKKQTYSIFAANGLSSPVTFSTTQGWAYPSAYGNTELTNTSRPASTLNNQNTDNTYFMSKPITNMSVSGGLASFDFMHVAAGISTTTQQNSPTAIRYNLSGQRVDKNYKGIVVCGDKKLLQ